MIAILLATVFIGFICFSVFGLISFVTVEDYNNTVNKPFIVGSSNVINTREIKENTNMKTITINKPYKTICIEGYTFIQVNEDIEQLFILQKGTKNIFVPKVCK